jgi:asparagine synthase (glutamine-hydrolysing)
VFGSYAVAVGHGQHRHALGERATSLGLSLRAETRDLLLVGTHDVACVCDGDAILVGQAFDQSAERLSSLPIALSALGDCVDPGPALRSQWGNYALFLASPERALVYREPSGSVPVYLCGDEDGTVIVSDAELAAELGLLGQLEIDRTFLVHWLQFPFLRTRRTGLRGVAELLPGVALERSGSARWIARTAWHPSTFVGRKKAIEDPIEAANCLRETALTVVAAQSRGSRLVLRLSGGLDSSIIAACLAEADREFSCINFATRARDGDERDYARDVASRFRLKLLEVGEPREAALEGSLRRSFRPLTNPLLEPVERVMAGAADALCASLLIDGAGGDNLFCSISSAAPAIDALMTGNLDLTRTAIGDIAARTDCTVWDVLSAAGRRLLRRRPAWKEDRSFLRRGVMLPACELHPWLEDLDVPPGKREHVEALVHIQHFLDRSPSSVPSLRPLLSQPLLELCLRIPTWLWVRGGRDRAVARNAFEGLVPASVLQRRMKGSLQSLLCRSFTQLRAEMRELLMKGELAHLGIVDTAAIGEALMGEEWMTDQVQLRISEMVALELWLRSWREIATNFSNGP